MRRLAVLGLILLALACMLGAALCWVRSDWLWGR